MQKFILLIIGLIVISIFTITAVAITKSSNTLLSFSPTPTDSPTPTPTPQIILEQPSTSKILENDYHIFQTFNNCGPAALFMALSYYGINETQQKLGQDLRPYQNPQGDNDDKSVTLEELAEKSKEYDFVPYHRPNGNIEIIKLFITYDIPVIARTLTKLNEDIGHYRIIKGYDNTQGVLVQDDSLQGKNLTFSYDEFNLLWKRFSYEYLVLVPKEKVELAEAILQEDVDEKIAWQKAVQNSVNELLENPNDIYARFNLSVALYKVRDYQRSVEEFEKVENSLPFRTLWYQIEPILAYYELGNYDRVFEITDRVLNYYNRAFSELYMIRGNIYKNQGNLDAARSEFQKAVFYNTNLIPAQEALNFIN